MDPRESWQALQKHLSIARQRVDAGDRAGALEAVGAALAIDPNFLAARSLGERIVSGEVLPSAKSPAAPAVAVSAAAAPAVAPPPLVSVEGYARFEKRALRRRVDHRVQAARSAIDRRRFKEAGAAIDEIRQLDGNLPELAELSAALAAATGRRKPSVRIAGPLLTVAAAILFMLSIPTWLADTRALRSHPLPVAGAIATPVPTQSALLSPDFAAADAVEALPFATDGTRDVETRDDFEVKRVRNLDVPSPRQPTFPVTSEVDSPPSRPPVTVPPVVVTADATPVAPPPPAAPPPSAVLPPTVPASAPSVPAPVTPTRPAIVESQISRAPIVESAPPPSLVDEEALVRRTLQQYRMAYEGLDAQSAQDVWPAVNQPALARAFDDLESQRLTFEGCDIQLRGDAAARAICRGSARYVPKYGRREARIEPRVWNFTLRKQAGEWKIETARTER